MRARFVIAALGPVVALVVAIASLPAFADDGGAARAWAALKSGKAFAIMRHALAPGTGDPKAVVIGDCSTQRNLSDRGREQSKRIGDVFRKNGITNARVVTSQWCRCRETSRLLGIGDVEDLPALNSFFRKRDLAEKQTAKVRRWLAVQPSDTPLVLVTHQVNMTALTRGFPRSGETFIVRFTNDADQSVEILHRFTGQLP